MEGFNKLDLNSGKSDAAVTSPESNIKKPRTMKFKFKKKPMLIILGVVVVLFALSFFTIVLPAQRTIASAQKTYQQAQATWAAIKTQNIELASGELAKTKQSLQETQKDLESFSYARFIPLANNYYNDADHAVSAGLHSLDAATIVVESIKPYADVLGLKGQGSFTGGSAEQRIQTAILTLSKITPRIDDVAKNLELARDEIDQIDPNHYPSFLGLGKVHNQLEDTKKLVDEGVTFVSEARPLIKVLPSLLGEKEEKKYLVLFQNDKELRPTGGFITAYTVFRVDKGIIHVDGSDDIYSLDNSIPTSKKPKAPAGLIKYLPNTTVLNLRDSNTSPDFVASMKQFLAIYENSTGRKDIDGIIALDTNVLVSTIKILDDEVVAGGITFTSKPDERCGGCPQVIYELEDNISRPVNYVKTARKDLLGTLLYAIMEKALKSSPKLYWGPLIQDSLTMANQKHILFYLFDKNAQSGIETLNAAGKVVPFDGDYFMMVDTNLGGAKSNLFVKEAVTQEYKIESDGTITKTVTFNYKNDQPPSDCNLERGGLCLNATLRDWFRVYVPKGSQLVDSSGSEVKMTTGEDLGKTVLEGFLTVRPLGQKKLTITYKLPFKLEKGSDLPVLIQKQAGTDNNQYTILVNGKEKEKFELLTDKKFSIKP